LVVLFLLGYVTFTSATLSDRYPISFTERSRSENVTVAERSRSESGQISK